METNEFDDAFEEFANEDVKDELGAEEVEDQLDDEIKEDAGETEEDKEESNPLQAELDALKKQNQDLEQYKRSNEGRVSALQKKVDSFKEEPVVDDKWEEFKTEDEFTAQHVEDRVSRSNQELKDEMMQEMDDKMRPMQEQEQDRYANSQKAILTEKDPDWFEKVNSDKFKTWLSTQPTKVQELSSSFEAADYQYLLDNYNAVGVNAQDIKQERKKKLESSETVTRRNTARVTGAPDDFDGAFDYYAKEDEKIKARGY